MDKDNTDRELPEDSTPLKTQGEWDKPKEVSQLDMAFGAAGGLAKYLPAWKDIPDWFTHHGRTWANKLISTWFFDGLNPSILVPKEGIDKNLALRHLKTCMGSFEPKHKHKEAGCAYLMSLWFHEPKGVEGSEACSQPTRRDNIRNPNPKVAAQEKGKEQ